MVFECLIIFIKVLIFKMLRLNLVNVYYFEINVLFFQKFYIFEDKRFYWFKENDFEFFRLKDY